MFHGHIQPKEIANCCLALTSAQFHPDGHLFAAGGSNGQIKLFDVTTGSSAANFEASGSLQAISFSENGTWLASAVQNSTTITIWDLRKLEQIKLLETGGQVRDVKWDYTGQFLATAGTRGVTVQQYSKSAKAWSEPLKSAVSGVALGWGTEAKNLVILNEETITVLGCA